MVRLAWRMRDEKLIRTTDHGGRVAANGFNSFGAQILESTEFD